MSRHGGDGDGDGGSSSPQTASDQRGKRATPSKRSRRSSGGKKKKKKSVKEILTIRKPSAGY
jgi:hypothetical protein